MKRGQIVVVSIIYSVNLFSILAQILQTPIARNTVGIIATLLDAENCWLAAILAGKATIEIYQNYPLFAWYGMWVCAI